MTLAGKETGRRRSTMILLSERHNEISSRLRKRIRGFRSRAAKAMPEETTLDDLDSIKCSPWASSGVLRDVLPDVPRPKLSRDEPPFSPDEERPVPRNMKITQDIIKKFGDTTGCAKCRKLSRNEYSWHTRRIVVPGLRQQAGHTLCIVIEPSEQNSKR